jgi:transcriptional regulator CtsR
MTVSMAQDLMQLMFNEKIVTEREGNLLLATLSHPVVIDLQRAILLTPMIHRLDKMD